MEERERFPVFFLPLSFILNAFPVSLSVFRPGRPPLSACRGRFAYVPIEACCRQYERVQVVTH